MPEPLLQIDHLSVGFHTERGLVTPVLDVSYSVYPGQTLAVVGESGSGKSVTALSILRLIPSPPGEVLAGRILLENQNLLELSEPRMRAIRGRQIAMIFQEPMTSLNPVFTIGDQIIEAIRLHQKVSARQARAIAETSLHDVGIADPRRRLDEYPHQMSGGMRQRVMIAMALSCQPRLLIADEPTTALDVTIQAQILELLQRLQRHRGMAIILITHDLGVVAENADVVAVMYAGRVVEYAAVDALFDAPLHPYTRGLLRSVPTLAGTSDRLETIPGTVPNPARLPTGCPFHPRCQLTRELAARAPADQRLPIVFDETQSVVMKVCAGQNPALREVSRGHWSACHFSDHYPDAPVTVPQLDHTRQVPMDLASTDAAQMENMMGKSPQGGAGA